MYQTIANLQDSQPSILLMSVAVAVGVITGAIKWIAIDMFDSSEEAKNLTITWVIIIIMTIEFFGCLLLTGVSAQYIAYHYKELSHEWLMWFGLLFLCWTVDYNLYFDMIVKVSRKN